MSDILLPGLDGSNPLGFLAALGVLNVLGERHSGSTLGWTSGDWRPILRDARLATEDQLIAAIAADLGTWIDDPCLSLKYKKASGSGAWDLKPPPQRFRAYLDELVQR